MRTRRGRPCLALVMDIWPGRAVGWSMSDRMGAALADDALSVFDSLEVAGLSVGKFRA